MYEPPESALVAIKGHLVPAAIKGRFAPWPSARAAFDEACRQAVLAEVQKLIDDVTFMISCKKGHFEPDSYWENGADDALDKLKERLTELTGD